MNGIVFFTNDLLCCINDILYCCIRHIFYTFVIIINIMVEYTHINSIHLDLQNIFTVLFLFVSVLILFNMYTSHAKYKLNITHPNIYVFEYERQSKSVISSYQIINTIVRILGYTLLFTSLLYYYTVCINNFFSIEKLIGVFFLSFLFVVLKPIFVSIYFFSINKYDNLYKIRHIRVTFDIFLIFYLIFLSFLVFFFPYHKILILIIIITLIVLLYIYYLLNYTNSLTKHIKFKTYQLILYLCISEILPIMLVIYWLSFHII